MHASLNAVQAGGRVSESGLLQYATQAIDGRCLEETRVVITRQHTILPDVGSFCQSGTVCSVLLLLLILLRIAVFRCRECLLRHYAGEGCIAVLWWRA